jgi:methyltransferase (TIGR00027 family)
MKESEKRIESKTSRTAEVTCLVRAASFYEKKPEYQSNDYIAPKLLPKFFLPFIKINVLKKFFINQFIPPGMYEYIIARTKYIDSIFKQAILNECEQILIFGAGFDTRGIRLANADNKTKIFELDAPITQEAKINQFKKRGIQINPNLTYISMDFNKQSLEEKLKESGFNKNKKSLFILEGLTMYLNPEAIDNTLYIINKFAGKGSRIVFDYVYSSVIRGENLYYGESEILKNANKQNEPWSFGIEKGEITSFLEERDFILIQNLSSEDLENKFFKNKQGNNKAKMNGTHCIAYAKKID